jgi:two-component system response regulator AtoC
MAIETALIIAEEQHTQKLLRESLQSTSCQVSLAETLERARVLIEDRSFDLILCDISLSPSASTELLQLAKRKDPDTMVILITPYDDVGNAVEAMRHGAFSYLIKPFSQDTIEAMLEKAQEHSSLLEENQFLRKEISTQQHSHKDRLIAQSDLMKKILSDVSKIAASNASVFINGESGTGKEVIAHAIHFQSSRSENPFIKVNCAAIPAPLLESEFFGHEKGAFTGAINKKLGRFELADKGTLLLDEISEIPLELQPKLLRAIQEMEFERVGGVRSTKVDVRLISTSNRSMKEAIEQKIFREDLYYRLNVVPIHLPPLRDRKEDILPLASYFLEKLCGENNKPLKKLSSESQAKLLAYPWPGNIRELANVMERSIVMNHAEILYPEHLTLEEQDPRTPAPPAICFPSGITLQEMEKRLILQTLADQQNNRTKTAHVLGISIRTLRNKLQQYQEVSKNLNLSQ